MSVAPTHRPRPAPTLRRVLAQARLELRLLVRSGESLVVTFGIPLGMLVFFGTVELLPLDAADPVDVLLPGSIAVAVMATGFVAQAISTAFERKYGVLKRLGATPLTRADYLLAKGLAVAVVVTVQVVVLVAVGTLLRGGVPSGATPGCGGGGCRGVATALWLVPLAVVLGAVVFTALGLALAGAVRAELVLAGSNGIFLLLLMGSDLIFELPEALGPVVLATPSGALGIVLRRALDPAAWTGPVLAGRPGLALVVLVAWGLLAVAVAARTFRWEA